MIEVTENVCLPDIIWTALSDMRIMKKDAVKIQKEKGHNKEVELFKCYKKGNEYFAMWKCKA